MRGTRDDTARVAVRATTDAPIGTHPITLEFRLTDGTRLVPSAVEADIRWTPVTSADLRGPVSVPIPALHAVRVRRVA